MPPYPAEDDGVSNGDDAIGATLTTLNRALRLPTLVLALDPSGLGN